MTRDLDTFPEALVPGLQARQRRQAALIGAAVLGATGVAGLALGIFTLWQGWSLGAAYFALRGTGILAVASLALLAARTLRRATGPADGKDLAGLLDLELGRAFAAIGVVRLGLAACATALLCGLAGTAIRYASGDPPALSPLVDVALLAGGALALLLAGFRAHARLLKFAYLRRVLRRD